MEPGEKFDSLGHSEGSFALWYVLNGMLELNISVHAYRVNPGCSVVAKTDLPHSYKTRGIHAQFLL